MDNFALIGPGVDYTEVAPINQKRIVVFVNHFVYSTVAFLNKFYQSCELKLQKFEDHLQKLEASLSILEAKLNSVSGLEDSTATAAQNTSSVNERDEIINSLEVNVGNTEETSAVAPSNNGTLEEANVEVPPPEDAPANTVKISQAPGYAKFFRMVQVGVPPRAVKLKMQAEGFDPDLLDDPNAPAPPENTQVGEERYSESDSD